MAQPKGSRKTAEHVCPLETLEPRLLFAATHAVNSGGWLNAATWDNGVPTAENRAIIDPGVVVSLLNGDNVAKEVVVHGTLRALDPSSSVTRSLTTDWVHVNSGGLFRVGTAGNRFDTGNFVLTLTGDDPDADFMVETIGGSVSINDNNAFLMAAGGGQILWYGDEKLAFTKLAETADVNDDSVVVENVIERNFDGITSAASDGALDWKVGDEIVIASSSYDYADEDVRTVTAIESLSGGRSRLVLDAPLANRHYGEIETYGNGQRNWDIDLRAEVVLLSRSVVIQGDAGSDTDNSFGDRARWNSGASDGVGGHVMILGSAGQITLDAVQFDQMGQTGRLGRYPVHWHLAGNRTGDVLRNASVTNSNNRGVTLHGTQNVLLENNALHDIHGHGFFMEDGAEFGNTFASNIALGIHRVGGGFSSNDPFVVPGVTRGADGKVSGTAPRSGNGESSHDTGQSVARRFLHSSAYWITNPDNTWVGNVSAGSEGTGFWFALPDSVLALSRDTGLYPGYHPLRQNLGVFDHNTSHASPVGVTFDRGGDIDPGSSNHYAPPIRPVLNHLTSYKHAGTAVYHRGANTTFNESRFADNANSSFNTFSQIEQNILFVGHSRGNADTTQTVGGFRLYDGPGEIIDAHFAGFQRDNAHTFRVEGGANKHAHTRASGISYENDGTADHLSIDWVDSGNFDIDPVTLTLSGRPDAASGIVLDVDGSLTGHGGGGAGFVLTPKIEFQRDNTDLAPAGWNAYLSDDRYAQLKLSVDDGKTIPPYRITNGAGNSFVANRYNLLEIQRQYVKVDAGDYTVAFLGDLPAGGFGVFLQTRAGGLTNASTVFRVVGVGETMKPTSGTEVTSLDEVRSSSQLAYFRAANGNLWIKRFAGNETTQVQETNDPPLQPRVQGSFFAQPQPVQDGATLEAEHYDEGGEGLAYHDTSPETMGNPSRDESVDGGAVAGASGERVGWTAVGEWLEYTVDVQVGIYDIGVRYSAGSPDTGSVRLLVGSGPDGTDFQELGVVTLPPTGGWQSFATATLSGVALPGGNGQVFRMEVLARGFDLDYFQFNAVSDATVEGRFAFYNGSAFDGNDDAANAGDDNAIATDKRALLPGQTATFANVTTYSDGVNGIALDIRNLASGTLQADDFAFAIGNGDDVTGFVDAGLTPVIHVRPGGGTGGADRVSLALPDRTARNQWLRVTVLANADTGLAQNDTFYFGNLPGETGDGAGAPRVNVTDIRRTASRSGQPALIDDLMDFNRDGRINVTDIRLSIAGSGTRLDLLGAPAPAVSNPLNAALTRRAAASYVQWRQLLGGGNEDPEGGEHEDTAFQAEPQNMTNPRSTV